MTGTGTGTGTGVVLGRPLPDPGPRTDRAAWRRRLAARRFLEPAYRLGVGIVGSSVVLVGVLMIPLPGPGWATVLAGLLVLASEFDRARRLLAVTRRFVLRWTGWVGTRGPVVRLSMAVGTAVLACGAVAVALAVAGAPEWLPDWVPGRS